MKHCLTFLFIFALSGTALFADHPDCKSLSLQEQTVYRRGDFTGELKNKLLKGEFDNSSGWLPLPHFLRMHKYEVNYFWYKVKLPTQQQSEPTLFIGMVSNLFEIYLDNRLIHRYGKSLDRKSEEFHGFFWHTIPLPPDYQGKTLYIRVFSRFWLAGLRDLRLGPKSSHIQHIILQDSGRLIAACIIAFAALLSTLLMLRSKREKRALAFSFTLLLWAGAPVPIISTYIKFILNPNPIFWFYVALIPGLISVGLLMFYENVFGPGSFKIVRRLWQAQVVLYVANIALFTGIPLDLISPHTALNSFAAYNSRFITVLAIANVIVIAYLTIKASLQGEIRARFFALGSIILLIFAVPDLLRIALHILIPSYMHWGFLIFLICLGFIVEQTFTMSSEKLELYEREIAEADRALRDANLKNLQDRMNPHFLFNSLNTIHAMIYLDIKAAARAVMLLAENYRYLLVYASEPLIPWHREWEFLENYLQLQLLRFKDQLNTDFNSMDELKDIYIPPLILQPLVENSIKHGLRKKSTQGFISVRARPYMDGAEIEVLDNGAGLPENQDDFYSRSLGNIKSRLKFHFREADLSIQNRPEGGAVVRMRFYDFKKENIFEEPEKLFPSRVGT